MRLLFYILVDEKKLGEFNDSNYLVGNRAFLQDNIGHSKFWLLDEYGNLIKSFEDLLLDVVINLSSNYNSLNIGEITQGNLFVMEAEWDRHLWFTKVDGKFRISFRDSRDIVMTDAQFQFFIKDFVIYAFNSLEYFYKDIANNPHYVEWKKEVQGYLD